MVTMTMNPSEIAVAPRGALDDLLAFEVWVRFADRQPLSILDAGCGRMWTWDLRGLDFRLTGVDADADALELRLRNKRDLDDYVIGDLRTTDMGQGRYDIVYSAYALEHVRGADKALDRMCEALAPGGLMIVKVPDRNSVYAFLTRCAPHSLHIWYKKVIRRKPLAGTPGHGPYPVVYDEIVQLRGLLEWAGYHRLRLVTIYGDNSHLEFFGKLAWLVDAGLRLLSLLSLRKLTARYSNLAFVFEKPG